MLDPTDPAAYSWTPPVDRAIVDAYGPDLLSKRKPLCEREVDPEGQE